MVSHSHPRASLVPFTSVPTLPCVPQSRPVGSGRLSLTCPESLFNRATRCPFQKQRNKPIWWHWLAGSTCLSDSDVRWMWGSSDSRPCLIPKGWGSVPALLRLYGAYEVTGTLWKRRSDSAAWGLRFCISHKIPGDTDAAGPQTTIWVARMQGTQTFGLTREAENVGTVAFPQNPPFALPYFCLRQALCLWID